MTTREIQDLIRKFEGLILDLRMDRVERITLRSYETEERVDREPQFGVEIDVRFR